MQYNVRKILDNQNFCEQLFVTCLLIFRWKIDYITLLYLIIIIFYQKAGDFYRLYIIAFYFIFIFSQISSVICNSIYSNYS